MDTDRTKIEEDAVAALTAHRDQSRVRLAQISYQQIHQILELPDGWTVGSSFASPETMSIGVVIHAPEFSPVEPGCHIPLLDGDVAFAVVHLGPDRKPVDPPGASAEIFRKVTWRPNQG